MNGETLKNLLKRTGLSVTDIAAKIGVTPQALNSTFNSPDVKSSIIEKVAYALDLPVSYLYGEEREIHNTSVSDGYKENSDNTNSNIGADNETMNRLLDELKALREQNTRLTDLLLNKK